jgi:hypothetical protein
VVKNIIIKEFLTLVAFVVASAIANFISIDLLGKNMVRLTYFYEVFFPLMSVIWMGHAKKRRKIKAIFIAICTGIGLSIIIPFTANYVASSNIALAANIIGLESIGVFIIYIWLWTRMRNITAEPIRNKI